MSYVSCANSDQTVGASDTLSCEDTSSRNILGLISNVCSEYKKESLKHPCYALWPCFPTPKSKCLYCSSCLPHSFCPLGISSRYFHCLECLLSCLHKNHILSSQPSQVSPVQMIKKKKKTPRNLFPNHMFRLQLKSLGQMFILHPPWDQRDSQKRLVFFAFFFFTLLFVITVSGEQRRDSAIHIHVSMLPQTPLCPGCHVTLSRVPCAI